LRRALRGTPALVAALIGLSFGVACELVVGLDQLNDRKCGPDEKRCGDTCVSRWSTATGCAGLACGPCVLPNATAYCNDAGNCDVTACNEGYGDCDAREPGCETDLHHDPKHCNGCFKDACVTANGTPGCSAGKCSTGGCNTGWRDCNRDPLDGCETNVTTDTDCGACAAACPTGTTCIAGACQ
jgi:hypothetical protein